jgi:hypothetical protein
MKSYYISVPGWVSAMSCYGLNRKDAIARFRKNQGFLRMPKGYAIWEAA